MEFPTAIDIFDDVDRFSIRNLQHVECVNECLKLSTVFFGLGIVLLTHISSSRQFLDLRDKVLAHVAQEFSKDLKFKRGTLGMARTSDPNSANSQFFITFEATPWLDGKYTIFGQVERGMQFVDQIKKGDPRSGRVGDPDIIVSMRVASDL